MHYTGVHMGKGETKKIHGDTLEKFYKGKHVTLLQKKSILLEQDINITKKRFNSSFQ